MDLEIDVRKNNGGLSLHCAFELSNLRCGLFGPSGSGKTTLLNMLAGLLRPDSGYIRLNGTTLFDALKNIDLPPEKRRVGVVFQHTHLFPHFNVRKNLFYGYQRTAPLERKIDPAQVIDMLRLAPLLDRSVTKISGGERQRVALGRTILASPQLVLLDEPLGGLDQTLKYRIIPDLNKLFKELSIPFIFTSHSVREMRVMTSEILCVENGRVTDQILSEELTSVTNVANSPCCEKGKSLDPRGKENPTGRYYWRKMGSMLTDRPIF
jgi:molybdate transport system ATP-binding protein